MRSNKVMKNLETIGSVWELKVLLNNLYSMFLAWFLPRSIRMGSRNIFYTCGVQKCYIGHRKMTRYMHDGSKRNQMKMSKEYIWDLWDFKKFMSSFVVR